MNSENHSTGRIRPATFPADTEAVTKLFRAYEESLPVSLDFQNFRHEVASLPGKYAVENGGALYLACIDAPLSRNQIPTEQVVGCLCLRAFKAAQSCELKRLYLAPQARGLGFGRLLMDGVIARARELGYKEMLLDTLSGMVAARRLYQGYGFVEVGAYYESVPDAVFYRLEL